MSVSKVVSRPLSRVEVLDRYVEFALDDAVIVIARDRSQWTLDVGVAACPP